jgi:four helix bundle protein
MDLDEIKVYNRAMEPGELVWSCVNRWDYFSKDTIGKQLVRSMDSVAANISEGFGRYHYKESRKFVYYARGSLFETKSWIMKAFNRNLISKTEHENSQASLLILGKMLNGYIKSIGTVNEPSEDYGTEPDDTLDQ